ncbi:MAG: glycosyltransferase family 4 protein [Candidatus Eisenbacteria bacterium]|nr:glycosyltransferase family 4 protein [Candidatus Eisenbacteria bacterium]
MSAPHLLAVNFRDPAHPEAGGAELHLEEILLEAVARGLRVTWLASAFPGAAPGIDHRGIRIVRRGAWWNFNLVVPRVLRREFSSPPPDLVIEDINKAPCFTPLATRAKVAVVVPHLFGSTAFREAPAPVAAYVVLLETLIPWIYRRSRFLAISESTRDDLVRRGVARSRVAVVHCGLDHDSYRVDAAVGKSARPTILFVGRLRRYKGLDWVMRAFPRVLARRPDAILQVIGDGPHLPELKLTAARLGVAASVELLGFLPRSEKVRRMREAWMLVQPSPKEGWGLTVVEAGACGTAVVAAASPGLKDSVRDRVTGLLVPYDDDARLAEALLRVIDDSRLRESLAAEGVKWAARFTWPDCARRSLDALMLEGAADAIPLGPRAREGSA